MLSAALLGSASEGKAGPSMSPAACSAERSSYLPGHTVRLTCKAVPMTTRARVEVRPLSGAAERMPLDARGASSVYRWKVPATARPGAYGIYVASEQSVSPQYAGFFRVIEPDDLTTFQVRRDSYKGLPVLQLDGGMSAEFTLEKAADNLVGGVSHSWAVSAPGFGPRPVKSTPEFLYRSVRQAVDLYDSLLGQHAPLKSVLISTGVPSAPYVARVLGAPLLPMHFLASVGSIHEVSTMLATAGGAGLPSYATVSHDPSVHDGVAWIKLLELPEPYRDFIRRHRVEHVYILGSSNTEGGETMARRILDPPWTQAYAAGSIYLMYPQTSHDDEATLRGKFGDLNDFDIAPEFVRVVDWESGVSAPQLAGFHKSACKIGSVTSTTAVTATDLMDLYDLASFVTAAHLARNVSPAPPTHALSGFVLNPYLLGHPSAEAWYGLVPIVFWQANPVDATSERVDRLIRAVRDDYFPLTRLDELTIKVNVTRNFGGSIEERLVDSLARHGWSNIFHGTPSVDDVWDLADGMNSATELMAARLLRDVSARKFRTWIGVLAPLNAADLLRLEGRLSTLRVVQHACERTTTSRQQSVQ